MRTTPLPIAVLLASLASLPGQPALREGFAKSRWFGEEVCELRPADGVRLVLNRRPPAAVDAPLRLVVFATPNGNSIEQTLGCRAADGVDWHFDIQHVAAQVRRLRELAPAEDVALACVEADGLSWPAWRARRGGGGAGVRAIVAAARAALPGRAVKIDLCAHSGGGSFLWGYVEDGDGIPDEVERIVFLDANYSYAEARHGEPLRAWLRRAARHRLVVLADDDREVELGGKKVVGADGGTFRASQRMLDALAGPFALRTVREGDVELTRSEEAQVTVLRHLNPQRRILHTALVGDMNGLLWALTVGDDEASRWGTFGGPRAYTAWIQPEPGTGLEPAPAIAPRLPVRPADAPLGRELLASVAELSLAEREARLVSAIEAGNFPAFLRRPAVVECAVDDAESVRHRIRYRVAPDYLAVGDDGDFARVPLSPSTAQRIADRFGLALPTRRMVDQIHAHAAVVLAPQPLGEPRQAVATFLEHDRLIEVQRAGREPGLLVAGIKKDVVITPLLQTRPRAVAIYGWHHPDGKPIQPLYLGHVATYVDYSHGVRLVWPAMEVDDRILPVAEVLADPRLHTLLSDEGPLSRERQRY